MKKLVFMFVAFAAISFASCDGNKTANAEEQADSLQAEVVDSAAQDSVVADSAAQDSAQVDSVKAE